jgi:hypothetical protein
MPRRTNAIPPRKQNDSSAAPSSAARQVRCTVSPEVAGCVREEAASFAATVNAARAALEAATNTHNTTVAAAKARYDAAKRGVLRQIGVDDDATIVAVDGRGRSTILVIQLPEATHG